MLADRRQLFKPLNWVRVYFERKKYRGCQWLMARTPMQKQELVRLFDVPEDRIRVLPPPVMQSFTPKDKRSRASGRAKYHLSDRRWNFLFPSTGHRRKGLDVIIEAFTRLAHPDCRVVVAGNPVRRRPNPYLHYLGYVDAMEELYHACDATLLLSSYEPFGRVVAESLLCATPVFVSDRVGAQSLLAEEGMGCVVPTGDVAQLTAALAAFIAKPPSFPYHRIEALRRDVSWDTHIDTLSSLPKPSFQ